MRHDAGLVVCGAAAVEPVAAHGGLERRGLPVLVLAGRLHVVVGVEQDRRLAVLAPCACASTAGWPSSRRRASARATISTTRTRRAPRAGPWRPRRSPRRAPGRTRPTRPTGCARGRRGRRSPRACRPATASRSASRSEVGCGVAVMRVILSAWPRRPRANGQTPQLAPATTLNEDGVPRARATPTPTRKEKEAARKRPLVGETTAAAARKARATSMAEAAREGPRRHGAGRREVPSDARPRPAEEVRARLRRRAVQHRRADDSRSWSLLSSSRLSSRSRRSSTFIGFCGALVLFCRDSTMLDAGLPESIGCAAKFGERPGREGRLVRARRAACSARADAPAEAAGQAAGKRPDEYSARRLACDASPRLICRAQSGPRYRNAV